jgi:hypothetical protein
MMLTIEQALALAAVLNWTSANQSEPAKPAATNGDGRYVIVRSRDAGVQFGRLAGYEGSTVHLTEARQMWKWKAAEGGTLLDCAIYGVSKAGSKFCKSSPAMTVIGVCAIIDVAPDAVASFGAVSW